MVITKNRKWGNFGNFSKFLLEIFFKKLLPFLFVVSTLSAIRRRVSACETKEKAIQTSTIDVKKVVDEGRLVQLHTKHRVADDENGF